MADTRILFVMINLTQSLQWESSQSGPDKIAFHSPLDFPAIFLFLLALLLCEEVWSDWTYCVSAAARAHMPLLYHQFAELWGFYSEMRRPNFLKEIIPILTKWNDKYYLLNIKFWKKTPP